MGALGQWAIFMGILCMPLLMTVGAIHRDAANKLRGKALDLLKAQADQETARLAIHQGGQDADWARRLEERVRVLERIATDKGVALSDEIERLREVRPS
jgi:hypothetical protein